MQVKRAFKTFFVTKNKKQYISRQVLHETFLNLQHTFAEVPKSTISKSAPSYSTAPFFFEECLNNQVRIKKMMSEYTVDYHPISSELTSMIHPLIFLWTLKRFNSLEYFSNISESINIHS